MPGETIRLIDPQGEIRDVPIEAAGGALDGGWKVPTSEQEIGRVAEQAREINYGGVAGGIKAGVAAAARGATLGLSDVAARALGDDDAAIALEGLRAANPVISFAGEVGGSIAPALVTGGAALPAGAAARVGAGIAGSAAEGAGAFARIGRAAVGGAAEGALFGAGTGVSELALSQDPLTVERIASSLSSHALYGAGIGGAAGTLGKTAELGLRRAKGAIDGALERRLARATNPEEAIETGELHLLDKKYLKQARETELSKIDEARAPERQKLVDEIHEYRDRTHEAEVFKVTGGVAEGDIRELGGSLKRADKALRNALDNKAKLATEPERTIGALQQQEQAMASILDWGERNLRAASKRLVDLDYEVRADIMAGRVPGYVPNALTPRGIDLAVEREAQIRFEKIMSESKRFHTINDVFPGAIERNRELQKRIADFAAAPKSDRLSKIDEALEALGAPKEPSPGAAVLGAAAALGGPLGAVGAAAAAGNRVLGSFKQLAAAATTRAGKAASAFLGATAPATKYATPLATRTLAAARFSDDDRKAQPAGLPELYKARSTEVRNQVHIAADGTYQMRPAARAKMAQKFDGIRVADPILADQLETAGARRIEYLASILPRLTDFGTVQIGPERRLPPDLEMRRWARSVAALEDPAAVLERAAHGHVTPAEVAALRAVHAPVLDAFTQDVIAQLPTLQRNLPRKKRLALSILTGVPVDPTLTPAVLSVVQGMYASEPGTEGGTQAPRAQAQFGSVKRSDPGTASQRRQEGTST